MKIIKLKSKYGWYSTYMVSRNSFTRMRGCKLRGKMYKLKIFVDKRYKSKPIK